MQATPTLAVDLISESMPKAQVRQSSKTSLSRKGAESKTKRSFLAEKELQISFFVQDFVSPALVKKISVSGTEFCNRWAG